MELEKLFGLPAHPLLVHIPVVLVPLAAIIAIIREARPLRELAAALSAILQALDRA